jgi:hypothetical protein
MSHVKCQVKSVPPHRNESPTQSFSQPQMNADAPSAASGRNQRVSSHKGTKITKKSAPEAASYLRGFVASCEYQVFVP